jgi:membrane protein DedA with SNARE-associated domain
MQPLLSLIGRHGYLLVFFIVLAEAIGMPVPAAIALVASTMNILSFCPESKAH